MTDVALAPPIAGPAPNTRAATLFLQSRVTRELLSLGAVAVLFVAFTAALLWPWLAQSHSALAGPPEDNMNDFWNTWYIAVGADPAHLLFTRLLRFPEGTPLLYQSFAYPQVFAVAMLTRVFGTDVHSLVLLQNLTTLAAFPLAGVGAFYLARHMTGSTVAGLVGGFVFAFSPFHVAQAGHHAGVASIEFLPFFALAYLLAVEKRSVPWVGAAVLFSALGALSCWYYLFYGFYFIGFQLLYHRLRHHLWPTGWQLQAPALCIGGTIAALSPVLLPMVIHAGPSVYVGGGNTFVADLTGFFAFPPHHLLSSVTRGLYARFTGNPWETTVYLGFPAMALLFWHLWKTGFVRDPLSLYVITGMILFALLAGGEALHIGGAVTFLHLPDAVLDKLPFFANVRSPSRAIVFVYLFMSIGVGAAAAALWGKHTLVSHGALAVLVTLIVIDFWPVNLEATPVERSPGLALLRAGKAPDFGVLNLPFGYVEENSYMLEQAYHHHPMVDGNLAREMSGSLLNWLSVSDPARLRTQLADNHVKYILLHHPMGGFYAWNGYLPPVNEFLRTYPKVYGDRRLTILRVY